MATCHWNDSGPKLYECLGRWAKMFGWHFKKHPLWHVSWEPKPFLLGHFRSNFFFWGGALNAFRGLITYLVLRAFFLWDQRKITPWLWPKVGWIVLVLLCPSTPLYVPSHLVFTLILLPYRCIHQEIKPWIFHIICSLALSPQILYLSKSASHK